MSDWTGSDWREFATRVWVYFVWWSMCQIGVSLIHLASDSFGVKGRFGDSSPEETQYMTCSFVCWVSWWIHFHASNWKLALPRITCLRLFSTVRKRGIHRVIIFFWHYSCWAMGYNSWVLKDETRRRYLLDFVSPYP